MSREDEATRLREENELLQSRISQFLRALDHEIMLVDTCDLILSTERLRELRTILRKDT